MKHIHRYIALFLLFVLKHRPVFMSWYTYMKKRGESYEAGVKVGSGVIKLRGRR